MEKAGGQYYQVLIIDEPSFQTIREAAATLHTDFALETVTDSVEARMPLTKRWSVVPGVGLCRTYHDEGQEQITCRMGLLPAKETAVRVDSPQNADRVLATFGIEPAVPWGLSPTTEMGTVVIQDSEAATGILFVPRRKIADFHATLDARDINLAKYRLAR